MKIKVNVYDIILLTVIIIIDCFLTNVSIKYFLFSIVLSLKVMMFKRLDSCSLFTVDKAGILLTFEVY